jgi:thiol-disulfide isomerase/thioredoxin
MRRCIVGMFALTLSSNLAAAEQPGENVRLDLVTYKQLGIEIKNLQGKVILVDFWADYCQPCKQKFPHVVALHRKYANQGFTVVSVSVDDVTDADTRERVKAYLVQQRATCRNLFLAEKPDVWVPKLKMDSIPAIILFDQEGRMINRWDGNDINLPAIEKRITELLPPAAKP